MFDWLEDGLANMVIETYKEIGSGMTSVLAEAVKSPSVFNNTAWQSVTVFNKNVVLPIAWSILSLFLLMELAQLFKRADVRGLDSILLGMYCYSKNHVSKIIDGKYDNNH